MILPRDGTFPGYSTEFGKYRVPRGVLAGVRPCATCLDATTYSSLCLHYIPLDCLDLYRVSKNKMQYHFWNYIIIKYHKFYESQNMRISFYINSSWKIYFCYSKIIFQFEILSYTRIDDLKTKNLMMMIMMDDDDEIFLK